MIKYLRPNDLESDNFESKLQHHMLPILTAVQSQKHPQVHVLFCRVGPDAGVDVGMTTKGRCVLEDTHGTTIMEPGASKASHLG